MKRDIYLFSFLAIIILFLIIFQSERAKITSGVVASKISSMENVEQLLINLDCNIYIVEGEEQNILFEGPPKKISQVHTISRSGSIEIHKKGETLLAGVLEIFDLKKADLNVYITIYDLDQIRISNVDEIKNIKYTSSECLALNLSRGQQLIIKSKFDKSRV